MNYSKLEGKEVLVKIFGDERIGKVSLFDKDLGLTIQDGEEYLFCLNGPSSRIWKKLKNRVTKKGYQKVNKYIAKSIKEGTIEIPKIVDILDAHLLKGSRSTFLGEASSETCAFS